MRLDECNYLQVEEYLTKSDLIIIPVGSLENHGLHMPLGTDTMIPDHIAKRINQKSHEIMIAPTIPYGATQDIVGFAGTVSIGVEGLIHLLQAVCDGLYQYGFRRFVVLNGHGGNSKSIETVGMNLSEKGALLANVNWWLIAGQLNENWKGGHGGGEETAGIMAVNPDLIKYEYIHKGEEITNDLSEELPSTSWTSVEFKGGMITIPRHINRITKNGWLTHGMSIDPPTKATEAWGQEMLDTMANYVIDFCSAFSKVQL